MSIELPDLDDKTYAALVDEARAALPTIHPAWTDHNPSDPGIALIELLAWLTEMLIYRTGRISEKSERTFLRLLSGGAHGGEADLESATVTTLRDLRARYRAVTPVDFAALMEGDWPTSNEAATRPAASRGVARLACVPGRDLSAVPSADAPGHVSLLVVPAADPWGVVGLDLRAAVKLFFRDRVPITTRLDVVGPVYVPITLTATLALRDDAVPGDVRAEATSRVQAHLHPLTGGAGGDGWPFGRDVDVADLFALLDQVPGVEYVTTLHDAGDGKDPVPVVPLGAPPDTADRAVRDAQSGALFGIRIEPHELPRPAAINLELWERRGGKWAKIA
jgi:hypothetical protein